jgi:hypothetical protein
LCEIAPHRGCGSPNELRAARWIAQRLQALGYTTAEQPFRTTRDNLYLMPLQVFVLAVAAGGLALVGHRWVAAVLLAYAVAILLMEVSGYAHDLTLMPRFPSQNVCTEMTRDAPATIFVTAHYDSQRGGFLFHPRFLAALPWFFRICYLGILLELSGLASTTLMQAGLAISIPALLIFALAELTGRYTAGANDNGTGVALALYLAEDYARFRAHYPPDCDLRFLFTGCEEAGEKGMKAFLRAHSAMLHPQRTRFLNLDNLGTGKLTYLAGEGLVWYRRAGATLLRAAREMGQADERRNLLLPTDALPAAALGFEAISFLGLGRNGNPANYHYRTDTIENVKPEFLQFQQAFFKAYLLRLMAC